MKTFPNTCDLDTGVDKISLSAIKERRAKIEAGLNEMEHGLWRLGVRIETCRDKLSGASQKEAIAPLSLKSKLSSRECAIDLVARTRRIGFDTRAIERETKNNCRKLNELAVQLKDEVARRKRMDKKLPKAALKSLRSIKTKDPRPSATILRFSPIKTDE